MGYQQPEMINVDKTVLNGSAGLLGGFPFFPFFFSLFCSFLFLLGSLSYPRLALELTF